ncbi:pH-response regulator protein palA/RIM20 [Scedosporium apiospermum]|uniref:pH-response regulator protein palA/RIM20 n=1 Tax=Pseudallescheria apiosperma TaxID=563466 RepID=A0A084GG09_PSEDA|nr:pH-response regulator protein palA/RIM20 [Scedosporium apiospermum]KEZ46271.1 pH-response regulator protein palA/RIM20 [Scedosporium apiospermum]
MPDSSKHLESTLHILPSTEHCDKTAIHRASVMAANIISLPFRKGVHLSLSTAIKKYISVKYDQHPDMFRQDLEVIDALRTDAVNVREPHQSGIKRLQAYAAQLVWIGGKFPIDIGADFTWYPSLGYNVDRPMVRNNLKYELLNVLYNLAALYSQLAISSPRNTTEGLKTAANYFSLAAGVLQHMIKEVVPELRMSDPPEDMDAHTLESLTQLLLAQSQECFWLKAVMDGYRDGSIAKLAARVSDLYDLAGEAAVKSDAISAAWIHHMSAKHHHFAAAAQYRAARECLERGKFGEEVARLKDSVKCVVDGLKDTKKGYLNKTIIDDLQNLKKKVEEDLKRAERDNDMIYLNAVPSKAELKILDRANMAAAKTPPQVAKPLDYLGDQAEFGPALFSRLVPFSVHQATSIYEERRDRLVNQNIIQSLEVLTEDVHSVLTSLGLPGSLQALEKPLGLPHSLTQHAEEIRQADAINRINKSFTDIEKLRAADQAIFDEGLEILASEEEEDNRLRLKYGTDRWTRPPGPEDPQGSRLWEQVREIGGYFATSLSSDGVVREKFAAVSETLTLLAGPDRHLMSYVPSSLQATIPENLKTVIGRLRGAYNDVLRLESRRRKKVEALREKCRADDIRPDILKEAARLERTYPSTAIVPAHFEDFFEKRLDKLYEPELEAVDKEKVEQERLLTEVTRVNREFESQKKMGDGSTKLREQRLQTLENAYFKYKEIINNLEVGRKFYNDLSKIVGQIFRDQARVWANQRRMEARSLEDYFPQQTQPQHHQPVPQQQPQNTIPIPSAVQEPPPEAPIQSWAGSTVSPQQPRPMAPMQGMWTPDMPIKFGGPSAAPVRGNTPGGKQPSGTWDPNSGIKFG